MREKSDFGKKPVRRSKSEEKETPKTYMPRTAKILKAENKKSENAEESREPKDFRKREEKEDNYRSQRKVLKSTESSSKRETRETKGSTYKPRTLKSSLSKKESFKTEESFEKPQFDDRPKRKEKSEWSEKPRREGRSDRFEKREKFTKSDNTERNERRGKPEKFVKSDRFGKPDKFKAEKSFGRSDRQKKTYGEDRFADSPKESFKKPVKRTEQPPFIESKLKTDDDGLIRLNKYIANSGLCSRREADEFITKGQITVNGVVVTELGSKVKLTDEIRFKEKALDPERKVYILLNKPKDYVTTVEDPNATHTVMELIEGACEQRVYPVGRLDRNSTGLLLFTNDGELTKQLTHPSFLKKKIYEVGLDKNVRLEDMEAIQNGIDLDGEVIAADAIEYVDPKDKSVIGIEIHSGQNRVVRRIFEKLGYRVYKLDRVYFAGLTKKNLPRGKWRFLAKKEVEMLKMNRFK